MALLLQFYARKKLFKFNVSVPVGEEGKNTLYTTNNLMLGMSK